MTPYETKVIEALKKRYPKNRQFQVSRSMPDFFGGELVVVEVIQNDQQVAESYAYVNRQNKVEATFLNIDELAGWVDSAEAPSRNKRRTNWFSSDVISGIMAIIITLTICVILGVQQARNVVLSVPDLLVNALTLILGFYFGQQGLISRSSRAGKDANAD